MGRENDICLKASRDRSGYESIGFSDTTLHQLKTDSYRTIMNTEYADDPCLFGVPAEHLVTTVYQMRFPDIRTSEPSAYH